MTFVIIVHIFVSLFLILVVLLQPGNKGGMGGAFGGGAGGATVFGGRGANTFLAKITAGAAAVFMLTSVSLAYFSSAGKSAFDRVEGAVPEAPAPAEGEADDAPEAKAEEAAPEANAEEAAPAAAGEEAPSDDNGAE